MADQVVAQARQELEYGQLTQLLNTLWPLHRSLTGRGVRNTLRIIGECLPALHTWEVPSGTPVFDWAVPPEWVVRDARLVGPDGTTVVDVRDHNLHLLNYSAPYQGRVTWDELEPHLYYLADKPTAIPYVTSYYEPRWGFCITDNQYCTLPRTGQYEVHIDTEFLPQGSMTLGELVIPSTTAHPSMAPVVLFSTNTCHPSMALNELSGVLAAVLLATRIASWPTRRLECRFAFVPETIGALAYIQQHEARLRESLYAGYVLTCLGAQPGKDAIRPLQYRRTRFGNATADRAVLAVLTDLKAREEGWGRGWGGLHPAQPYRPGVGDERQYNSLGLQLPVGSLFSIEPGTYPEYHTSLDDRSLLSLDALTKHVDQIEQIARTLDRNRTYRALVTHGEPMYSKRGLYPTLGQRQSGSVVSAMRWLMGECDGSTDLLAVAQRSGVSMELLYATAQELVDAGLLTEEP